MKLFIIGNGFDIGHGLPTMYKDFRKYLELTQPRFLQQFEQRYNIYPGMNALQKRELLWNRFESNLANIDEETIIDSGTGIEMNLESGDVGIEDTLYQYFSDEYDYINRLSGFLKSWVRTINIRDTLPRTSLIDKGNGDLFLTFNYTAVLEAVYGIRPGKVIHIHGSLCEYTHDPIIGHGNQERIESIHEKINEAERLFNEKWISIGRTVRDYYLKTFKDTNKYSHLLHEISDYPIKEIVVIGHSLDGVDMPYFTHIDRLTGDDKMWVVYYKEKDEIEMKRTNLINAGVAESRIVLKDTADFYDLDDEEMKRKAFENKHGF